MATKEADSVSILVMNPQNGEIYAMVNVPEFDLNDPYSLPEGTPEGLSAEEKQNLLNGIWRNGCINDTYEPGSHRLDPPLSRRLHLQSLRVRHREDGTGLYCRGRPENPLP